MEGNPSTPQERHEEPSGLTPEDAAKLFQISTAFKGLGEHPRSHEVSIKAQELVSQGLLQNNNGFYVFNVPRSEQYPDGYVKILDIQSIPDFRTGRGVVGGGYSLSTYDNAGRLLTVEDHDEQGGMMSKSETAYYPNGRPQKRENHTVYHNEHWVETYAFDEEGNQLSRTHENLLAKDKDKK